MSKVQLVPLEASDREQFIKDNQEAFNYGAMEEFGCRDVVEKSIKNRSQKNA